MEIEKIFLRPIPRLRSKALLNRELSKLDYDATLFGVVQRLKALRLISGTESSGYDMHPLIREYFLKQERRAGALKADAQAIHGQYFDWLRDELAGGRTALRSEPEHVLETILHGVRAMRFSDALQFQIAVDRNRRGWYLERYVESLGGYEPWVSELMKYCDGNATHAPQLPAEGRTLFITMASALVPHLLDNVDDSISFAESVARAAEGTADYETASAVWRKIAMRHIYKAAPGEALFAAHTGLQLAQAHVDTLTFPVDALVFSNAIVAAAYAILGDEEQAGNYFQDAYRSSSAQGIPPPVGYWLYVSLARNQVFEDTIEMMASYFRPREGGRHPSYDAMLLAGFAAVKRMAHMAGMRDLDPIIAGFLDDALLAVDIAKATHSRYFEATALIEAAHCGLVETHLAMREKEHPETDSWLSAAVDYCRQGRFRFLEADANVVLGHVARLRGDSATARAKYLEAQRLATLPEGRYCWAFEDARVALQLR